MMTFRFTMPWAAGLALFGLAAELRGADQNVQELPPFSEVYSLVRSNLAGASEAELNRAAVMGILSALETRVRLITNSAARAEEAAVPLLTKAAVFDKDFAFLRLAKVVPGVGGEIRSAYTQLASSNKLQGVILDLRFATGTDYAAAAEAADLFVSGDQPLLNWGSAAARSTGNRAVIGLPLVVLVNRESSGAAEALAAALREAAGALVIGSPSAGRAYVFQDFRLSNGDILRMATGLVTAGQDRKLQESGLEPDIRITVKVEDEKTYFEDPYAVLERPFAQSVRAGTNDLASLQSTNRTRRRMNEAELVRMQREGMDFEAEPFLAGPAQPAGPVISDPALARALDLLKGLALATKRQ